MIIKVGPTAEMQAALDAELLRILTAIAAMVERGEL